MSRMLIMFQLLSQSELVLGCISSSATGQSSFTLCPAPGHQWAPVATVVWTLTRVT